VVVVEVRIGGSSRNAGGSGGGGALVVVHLQEDQEIHLQQVLHKVIHGGGAPTGATMVEVEGGAGAAGTLEVQSLEQVEQVQE
jgi:hypothetical protein